MRVCVSALHLFHSVQFSETFTFLSKLSKVKHPIHPSLCFALHCPISHIFLVFAMPFTTQNGAHTFVLLLSFCFLLFSFTTILQPTVTTTPAPSFQPISHSLCAFFLPAPVVLIQLNQVKFNLIFIYTLVTCTSALLFSFLRVALCSRLFWFRSLESNFSHPRPSPCLSHLFSPPLSFYLSLSLPPFL